MTILDKWDSFKDKVWDRSTTIPETPKKESAFQSSSQVTGIEMGDRNTQGKYSIDKLNPVSRRKKAFTAALYIKGLNKKSKDTFRAWFELEEYKTREKPDTKGIDATLIRLFNKRSKIKTKFTISDKCSHIYGDGLILITYKKDNTAGEKGAPDLSRLPLRGAIPYDLVVLDPERLVDVVPKNKYWKKQGIDHFHFRYKDGREIYVHPDRILHIARNQLPFSRLGIGDIDILVDIINSYSDINISTGEILKWFAHGLVTVTKANMQPNERADIEKELALHNNIFVNDDRFNFDVVKPDAINPQPFYEFIIQNIAGVLGMPAHMLTGVVIGKVTGAETAYSDYYRDVADDQEILYTPLIEKLYTQLLRSHNGKEFKYDVAWNQIYINESAEAELVGKRGAAATNLYNSGLCTFKEGREIMNKGIIEFNLNVPEINKDKFKPQDKPLPLDRIVKSTTNPKKEKKIASVIKFNTKKI